MNLHQTLDLLGLQIDHGLKHVPARSLDEDRETLAGVDVGWGVLVGEEEGEQDVLWWLLQRDPIINEPTSGFCT